MKKLFLLFWILLMISVNVFSQKDTIWPFIQSRSLGNYGITSKNRTQHVNINVERAIFKKNGQYGWNETDVSMIISNPKGSILYRKNYPGDQEGQLNISVDTIFLNGIGNELLVHYTFYPSCGSCGEDVQVFGFNSLGYLVPFTGVIRVLDKFSNNSYFNIKWVKSRNDLTSPLTSYDSKNCDHCESYLECLHFTGDCGFNTLEYFTIQKEGVLQDFSKGEVKSNIIPIKVGDSEYYTIDQVFAEDNNDIVKLYSEPNTAIKAKTMQLKKGMIIRFFEGLESNENSWVHLRITGYEGYILWEDVWKLGFPPCD